MASKIDFFGLPRAVQERFAAATRRRAPPTPLLFRSAPRTDAWLYLIAGAFFGVVANVFLWAGYANEQSPWALHDEALVLGDGVLFALAVYGVLHALGLLATYELLPYRPGTYLFPGCAVDARGSVLKVWPLADAQSVRQVTAGAPGVALHMRDGSRVIILASTAGDAERADAALSAVRRELSGALAEADPAVLSELDPLHARAMSSPIGPTHSMRPSVPVWTRLDWAIAAACGVLLGQVLGATRNALSDEAMFRAARTADTSAEYERYLARGQRHRGEVRAILLPRAELRQAAQVGTVEALERFAADHANTEIASEVQAALTQALLAELAKTQQTGTLAAIDGFARAHPSPLVASEVRSARHALYDKAVAAYRQTRHPDPMALDAVVRALAWAEKNGPNAEVRFRLAPPLSMADADKSVRRSGHFPGLEALPSNYVTSEALGLHEDRVATTFSSALGSAFPSEMLSIHPAARAPEGEFVPAVPTLLIEYSPEWSRSNALCLKPNTVFAGLIVTFTASLILPDDARSGASVAAKTVVRAWRGAETWKFRSDALSLADYHRRVYGAMLDGLFETLEKRLYDYWL